MVCEKKRNPYRYEDLRDWGGSNVVAVLVVKGAAAADLGILVDEHCWQVEVARRNLAPSQVAQVNLILVIPTVERAVNDGTVVRVTVPKSVRSHLVVDLGLDLNPVVVTVRVGAVAHDIEAVLLAIPECHPLASRSISAVLAQLDVIAPVGDEVELGGTHDVVGDLWLDVVADGLQGDGDGLLVVVDEEPAAVIELCDLALEGVPLGGRERIVLGLAGAATGGNAEGVLEGARGCLEGVGQGGGD